MLEGSQSPQKNWFDYYEAFTPDQVVIEWKRDLENVEDSLVRWDVDYATYFNGNNWRF